MSLCGLVRAKSCHRGMLGNLMAAGVCVLRGCDACKTELTVVNGG